MNSLSTRVALGAAALAFLGALSAEPSPVIATLVAASVLPVVAFAAQSRRLRDDQRLVYRPVYARRHGVHQRVRSDDR